MLRITVLDTMPQLEFGIRTFADRLARAPRAAAEPRSSAEVAAPVRALALNAAVIASDMAAGLIRFSRVSSRLAFRASASEQRGPAASRTFDRTSSAIPRSERQLE
jgi:hypothetical protein